MINYEDLHVMPNKSEEDMTPQERMRAAHIREHKKHEGHESMHAEMVLILFVTLIVVQVVLFEWKKRHFRSYLFVTMIGVWLIPLGISLKNFWWRFVFFWLLFSCITGLVMRKALQKPIQGTTPRLVYKWFYFIYRLSYVLGIIGYVIALLTFLGVNIIFGADQPTWMDCGLLFLYYGLYYGVLGRDLAEICADKMASHIGYYNPGSMPTRTLEPDTCAVCGNAVLVSADEEGILENRITLNCDHVFHEFCIRGWCIVGKKQTCPYCKEKVDLKKMFCNPWERPHVLYGQLLDWIRWLVAWQPLILFIVQGINWAFGLEISDSSENEIEVS